MPAGDSLAGCLLGLTVTLAQLTGRYAEVAAKDTAEVRQTVEAMLEGYVSDTTSCLHAVGQVAVALLEPSAQDVTGDRFVSVGEQPVQIS